jgi:putative lipoprotein
MIKIFRLAVFGFPWMVAIATLSWSNPLAIGQPAIASNTLLKPGAVANANRSTSTPNRVTGSVTYLQRIALPAGAVITIKLLDVSQQDALAKVIAEQTLTTTGEQVPIPFKLKFKRSAIQPQHSYIVRAEIRLQERLAFTSTRSYAVITQGNPANVEIVVEQVKSENLQAELISGEWRLEELGGTEVPNNVQTTLKFESNGRLGGSGGCNRYFASYQLEQDQLQVSQMGSTQMACLATEMDQEHQYFKALSQAYRIRLDGALLFIDAKGLEKPLKFTRIQAAQ